VDFVYSVTRNNYLATDANLFTTPRFLADGRIPVFVDASKIDRSTAGVSRNDSRNTRAFDQVLVQSSLGRSRSFQGIASVNGRVGRVSLTASYVYDRTRDNGSRSCCMSGTDFFYGAPAAGNPNVVGGKYGPADFNRVHTIVASPMIDAPLGLQVSVIYRGFSGRPYTPRFQTDVNGDGAANDRAYVPTAAEVAQMTLVTDSSAGSHTGAEMLEHVIGSSSCLRRARGRFVARNACRNPWQHVLDARVAKSVRIVHAQRAEIVADVFNVLNGLNDAWGRRLEVGANDEVLLAPVAFDSHSLRYEYRVNTAFGRATPTQLSLSQQFQLQLGVRYGF
jgi:hypothetical protein